jgi:phosphatidylserine/phosphatidylglycerophosphate/cardiolipin synthase-like enzyme
MKHSLLCFLAIVIFPIAIYAQTELLSVDKITKTSLSFHWNNKDNSEVILHYGLSPNFELGEIKGLKIDNLQDATFYYVKARSLNGKETETGLFSTQSKSSGDISVYFNQSVDNSASSLTNALSVPAFEDTIISYINSAQYTLDICNYNTGSIAIVSAINAAFNSGVVVRYIGADNTGTNNSELSNISPSIPLIQRPSDGEVMHNKFMIIDAATPSLSTVVTGSVNHTDNSCHQDYNNLVIIEDQSLAYAYEMEFEEMWGSTTNTPNLSNSKFGDAKTDNTPHSFTIGGLNVELYFSPSDGTTSHIETALLSADTDMQFAMLTFIHNDLGDAVITAHNAGVNVKGIIENTIYFGSEYNSLLSAGVDVYSHLTIPYYLHHKYGIVDANNTTSDPLVITGSHNWTNSAEDDYDENTLIIHDAIIANMYYEEFMARYDEVSTSINKAETNPKEIIVYPNPTKEKISIACNNMESVKIFDVTGKLMYERVVSTDIVDIDISTFSKGIIFVKVFSADAVAVERIVLE